MNNAHPYAPALSYNLPDASPCEISDGKLLSAPPNRLNHAEAVMAGALAIATDPAGKRPMLGAGFSPDPTILRAPDISVGRTVGGTFWIEGAPELAIRYVQPEQDPEDLARFVFEMLTAGSKWVWVVRLGGEWRVDVYSFAEMKRSYRAGERIPAPGVLQNPVRVECLFMRELALDAAFSNLMSSSGFPSVKAVRDDGQKLGQTQGKRAGRREGLREALRAVVEARGWALSPAQREAIQWCDDRERLLRWTREAAVAASVDALRFD